MNALGNITDEELADFAQYKADVDPEGRFNKGKLLRADTGENKTEVLKVEAELLEVRQVGSELEATVLFDSILREDGGETAQVREVWHFTKPVASQQPKWYLDGIQQLQD